MESTPPKSLDAVQGEIKLSRNADSTSLSSRDIEKGGVVTSEGQETDPNSVSWITPFDPENPKNWPKRFKWLVTTVISLFLFLTILCSTIIAPALPAIGVDLNITDGAELSTSMSIFVLGYAFGPLVLAPLSELYGRVIIIQASNVWFVIWTMACGFAKNKSVMIVARLMAGIGSSAALSVGGGILADVWLAAERGRSMALYNLLPLLAPAIGPLLGGFISQNLSWSWSFWIIAIATVPLIIVSFFIFHETYAPVLLRRRAAALRKSTGNPNLYTKYDKDRQSVGTRLAITLTRPTMMLLKLPIIQILSLQGAYNFGILYIALTTFSTLWIEKYRQTASQAGLNFLSLAVGLSLGTQIAGVAQDMIFTYLRRNLKDENSAPLTEEKLASLPPIPEHRIPLMIPSVIMQTSGLLIYGWGAYYRTHWIVPDAGIAIYTAGNTVVSQCGTAYLIDNFDEYTSSALAAVSVMKSLAGFGFPLFAPALYNALDWGWGNTLLAGLCALIGVPIIYGLWTWGVRIRAMKWFGE